MADGAIKVITEIDVKQASSSLMRLENSINKSADKIASLKSKMDSLKNVKVPTEEYRDLQKELQAAEAEFNALIEKQKEFKELGFSSLPGSFTKELDEARLKVGSLQEKIERLNAEGKAFNLGSGTQEFVDLSQKLQYAEADMAVLLRRHDEMIAKQKTAGKGYKTLANTAKKSFGKMNTSVKKSSGLFATFASRLKGIALSLFVFNWITKAFNAMVKAIKEGFTNMYNSSEGFKAQVDSLKASCTTLKNAFAAAFAPLAEIAIPYLQRLIQWLTNAINLFGQFIAALTGRKTYTKAIQQSAGASEDAAGAAKKEAEATEDVTKAQKGQLSSLDKLNVLTSQNEKQNLDETGSGTSGVGEMFEEVPIDSKVLDFIQKMKDLLAPVLDYAKKLKDVFLEGFFDGLGDWQYRWESIKDSVKSIYESLIDIFTDGNVVSAADNFVLAFMRALGQIVGAVASIGLTIATNLLGGLEKYLLENKERIKDYLISMFDIGAEISTLLGEFAAVIAYIFEAFASEDGQQLTANVLGMFSSAFMGVTELALKLVRDLANMIIQPFVDNKEAFRAAVEGFLSVASDVFGTLKTGMDETFSKMQEVYDEHFKPFFDALAEGISSITEKFLAFWNENLQPVLEEWATKFDTLWSEHLQPLVNNLVDFFGSIADLLSAFWNECLVPIINWVTQNVLPVVLPILQSLYNVIVNVFAGIFDTISGIIGVVTEIINFIVAIINGDWSGAWEAAQNIVTNVFNTVFGFISTILESLIGIISVALQTILGIVELVFVSIRDYVLNIWNNIKTSTSSFAAWLKTNISTVLSGIKETWNSIWNSFSTTISNVWNSITATISGAIEQIKGWITELLSLFDQASAKGSGLSSASFIGAGTGLVTTYSVDMPDIPGYATGQVIPRTMKKHLAYLGDNNQETEVVSPLSTIEQAVKNVISELGLSGNEGTVEEHIHLEIDGDEVFKVVRKKNREFIKSTGKSALA